MYREKAIHEVLLNINLHNPAKISLEGGSEIFIYHEWMDNLVA